MTKTEMMLEEIRALRQDMCRAVQRIEALENANGQLASRADIRAETADAQATYTAMMTDTLLEV